MESTPYVVPYSQIKTQRLHFALTMTCGRSPLRAWKTMEPLPADVDEAQPQWVSRRKSNFRRRHRDHANSAMVAAVMASAVVSCQSMITRYSNTRAPLVTRLGPVTGSVEVMTNTTNGTQSANADLVVTTPNGTETITARDLDVSAGCL